MDKKQKIFFSIIILLCIGMITLCAIPIYQYINDWKIFTLGLAFTIVFVIALASG